MTSTQRPSRPRSPKPSLLLGEQLCFALYSTTLAMNKVYRKLLRKLGLTYPQYVTMLALWDAPDHQLTVGALGARLHLDSGTLTPLLKRLETLGYVRRERDNVDERRVIVAVTEQGLALQDKVASVPIQ